LPAGEAPALQIASLRAFFERGGLTAQVRQNFASEMQRAGYQDRIWFRACNVEGFAD